MQQQSPALACAVPRVLYSTTATELTVLANNYPALFSATHTTGSAWGDEEPVSILVLRLWDVEVPPEVL